MKKSIYTVVALLGLLYGCSKNENTPNGVEEPKNVLVSLAFKGEILEEDTPMSISRSGESSDDLYGIQIYKDGAPYQYGLFDNTSNLQALLQRGSTYKFECTLVKDGKNKLYKNTNQGGKVRFGYPFVTNSLETVCELSNGLIKTDAYFFMSLSSSCSYPRSNSSVKYNLVDRYYGELDNYIPTEDGIVSIELKHTVFGIKTIIQGIPDGSVAISIKSVNTTPAGTHYTFYEKTDITSDYQSENLVYECGDVFGAWQYADNYTENVIVSVRWTRSVGVVQDLGSKEIQVKRNMMNVIRISLSADDGNANIGITTDTDGDMSDENTNIDLN